VSVAAAAAAAAVLVVVVALLAALLARWPLVLAVLVLLVVAGVVVLVTARVLRPIRTLTDDVDRAANETLPAAAPALESGSAVEARPDVTITARGPADVVALAGAVTSFGAAATSLATEEHGRHRRTRDLTTHLARRNHGLVDRLVTQIGELETAERSPTVLSQLSRLKHTATRTRRHAESMLVLTGSLPDRSRPRPAAVTDVLHTALTGIEDHPRVGIDEVEPAAVSGSAVADLAHLVAELVENGAHFSPPETRVRITGTPDPDGPGYCIRIADRGVGMAAESLEAANGRIRGSGAQAAQQAVKLIGLDVVGRLAARHGITVTLESRPGGGVIATVTIPDRLLVPLSDLPAPRRPVSALVAAAAFRPPLASGGDAHDVRVVERNRPKAEPAAVAEPELVRPGVPRRVRGAQLPDLGPDRKDGPHVTPDAGRVHGRLHALQSGLAAARTDNIPPLPQPLPGPDSPRVEPGGSAPALPARAPDGDD
jgi:signal transduction histidine kinase